MRRPRVTIRALKLMILSAVCFWSPDTLVHAIRANVFSSIDVIVISVAMPLCLLVALVLAKQITKIDPLKHIAAILTGVWLFGGVFMFLGATFSGGGFSSPMGIRWVVTSIALSLLPPYAFILAAYDGALWALLFITSVAALVWTIRSRGFSGFKGGEVRYNFKR
jgi:hypothetical protein